MAETELDKYGRVLIPKEVRAKLGLARGQRLRITIRGSEMLMRMNDEDLKEKVKALAEYLEREAPKPFVAEAGGEDSKWLSREHCLRKLGL